MGGQAVVPPEALGPSARLWCLGGAEGNEGTGVLDVAEKTQWHICLGI